ncbi:hypothetical protein DL96DRAFT_421126 [Flagelloscypha sp. PMI_526]|nr:hypothetical protein DL96DRAFT_421126 [Flagelloscypha sp. PMI_526]
MDSIPPQSRASSGDDSTPMLPLDDIGPQSTLPDPTTEPPSSHPTIFTVPEEIQHLIFTFVFRGETEPFIRKTRLICCLVCRSMRAYHQTALFNRVELAEDRTWTSYGPRRPCRILAFYRALSISNDLGRLVHTLAIDIFSHWGDLPKTLAQLPSLLPNVLELRLDGPWASDDSFHEFIREALRCWRTTLRRLSIKDTFHRPSGLLFGWEALEHLGLNKAETLFFPFQQPGEAMPTSPRPSLFSLRAVLQRIFQRRNSINSDPLPTPAAPDSEECIPDVDRSFSLQMLSLHFQSNILLHSHSRSIIGSDFISSYGSKLSRLHITGNFTGFTIAPNELPSLECLIIDVQPVFIRDPGAKLAPLKWLIQFVKQQSTVTRQVNEWNLKLIQLDTAWFPKYRTNEVVLLQIQELSRALLELNEMIPKVVVVTKLSKVPRWEGLLRDLEGAEVGTSGGNVR